MLQGKNSTKVHCGHKVGCVPASFPVELAETCVFDFARDGTGSFLSGLGVVCMPEMDVSC